MSSWTFETFDLGNIHASYMWNKEGNYQVYVGCFRDHVQWGALYFNRYYATKEEARRAFKRQVNKIKKGGYNGLD